jgi:hypothetical protein
MRGSAKFEVRSSKQIRRAKVPLTPALSPSDGERGNARRALSWRKLGANSCASIHFVKSVATKSVEPGRFEFRDLNLIRVSGFEFRIFTSCK